ncbi:MAG: NAD(P)/FAD-dependent oxidoreductase, partial [Flavobacterium sp.]
MTLSYWEQQHWFTNVDFTIVGSGIVGLQTALHLREQYPDARILVLERSPIPEGASTKNAGFACFGSVTELLSDLQTHSEHEVVELVQKRWEGLQVLKSTVGSEAIQFEPLGGYEFFLEEEHEIYQTALSKLEYLNELLYPLFRQNVFSIVENQFGFQRVQNRLLFNALEGQIDPGLMMQALLRKAHQKG